ncbi:MAG: DUF4912 domain-containing protein [Candidatus Omnitrophica bacterium]|nr:DUF4912 domain-containing protein [Candidatus Omnitrophota bacterium]MBL7210718.1 DUF4912 domain-containing protein [Candidatus Omnitrophota bacterium]
MHIVRKKKSKLKKSRPARGTARSPAKKPRLRTVNPLPYAQPKKETFPSEEVAIERQKFSQPAAAVPAQRYFTEELPQHYGRDVIVLQVRDPKWLHAYWELQELKEEFHNARLILRVYDISQIIFDGRNAHSFFDIEISGYLGSWYIQVGPGRSWCAELGFRLNDGTFIKLLRSNTVHTPLDGPSRITDEEWMVQEDIFARLYGMGFGFGKSSPVGKAWQKRIKKMLLARDVSSRRISS